GEGLPARLAVRAVPSAVLPGRRLQRAHLRRRGRDGHAPGQVPVRRHGHADGPVPDGLCGPRHRRDQPALRDARTERRDVLRRLLRLPSARAVDGPDDDAPELSVRVPASMSLSPRRIRGYLKRYWLSFGAGVVFLILIQVLAL